MESGNKYFWNKTLKFSWGHIIAFVALIFISYVVYMGDFYHNGGDFMGSLIKVLIIDVALLVTFIGAQILKGTDHKFAKHIWFERVLIILCPIVFAIAIMPYNHFWHVYSQKDEIESEFTSAISGAKQLFYDYEEYSGKRIDAYENSLAYILNDNDQLVKDTYVNTLRLQLLSQNTDSLKNIAFKWINEASQGATVWNAFLIGNIKEIDNAIKLWNDALVESAKPVLSNEDTGYPSFEKVSPYNELSSNLNNLQYRYHSRSGFLTPNTIWTSILLFAMLLFPYLLQSRNLKAQGYYRLLPGKKQKSKKSSDNKDEEDPYNGPINNDDIYSGTLN